MAGYFCCYELSGPLRQYFSLYGAVSRRKGETGEKGWRRIKMSKQPHPTYYKRNTPCPTIIQIVGPPALEVYPGPSHHLIPPRWRALLKTITPPDPPPPRWRALLKIEKYLTGNLFQWNCTSFVLQLLPVCFCNLALQDSRNLPLLKLAKT